MFLNGVSMKYRIFILSAFLAGCTSTKSQVNMPSIETTKTDLVVFVVKRKLNSFNLKCSVKNKETAKRVLWITECNELAFNYLTSKMDGGIEFYHPIKTNAFGMAADARKKALMKDSSNIQSISLMRTFKFSINKT